MAASRSTHASLVQVGQSIPLVVLDVESFHTTNKVTIILTTDRKDVSISVCSHGKMVSGNVHRSLLIHREDTLSVKDTTARPRGAIDLEEPLSDLD